MSNPNKISSKGGKITTLLVLFSLFLNFAIFAQNERDRNIPDLPKNTDSANQYESPESSISEQKSENFNRQTISPIGVTKPATSPSKKDNALYKVGGEKEIRKEGMSTLSFNLFLYIVDKFKED